MRDKGSISVVRADLPARRVRSLTGPRRKRGHRSAAPRPVHLRSSRGSGWMGERLSRSFHSALHRGAEDPARGQYGRQLQGAAPQGSGSPSAGWTRASPSSRTQESKEIGLTLLTISCAGCTDSPRCAPGAGSGYPGTRIFCAAREPEIADRRRPARTDGRRTART